jgi:hypothetical protein
MRTITRKFNIFQDDATGEFGIAINDSDSHQFNAFWNGQGIFHDCFEHFFEGQHFKNNPFKGRHAYTVFGEIAALGAASYYFNYAGCWNRPLNGRGHDFTEGIFREIFGFFQEAKDEDNDGYFMGFKLPSPDECPVKNQPPVKFDDMGIFDEVPDTVNWAYGTEKNPAKNYNKAVRNLMRWGARQAQKLEFDGMAECIEDLQKFTKRVSGEDIANTGASQLEFRFLVENGSYRETRVRLLGHNELKDKFVNIAQIWDAYELLNEVEY